MQDHDLEILAEKQCHGAMVCLECQRVAQTPTLSHMLIVQCFFSRINRELAAHTCFHNI